MDLDDLYSSFGDFWTSIALVVYVNLIALVGLRWIAGVRFHPLRRLRQWQAKLQEDDKTTLNELGLWSKLPYLAIVGVLFYLTIFSSTTALVLAFGESEYVGFQQDDTRRWQELDMNEQVTTLASYYPGAEDGSEDWNLYDLRIFEDQLLSDYRARFAELYDSWIGWTEDSIRTALFFYQAGILLFWVLLFAGAWIAWKRWRSNATLSRSRIARYIGLLLLIALTVLPLRYRAEAAQDRKTSQSLFFVASQLVFDPSRSETVDDHVKLVQKVDELMDACPLTDPPFWLSRKAHDTAWEGTLRAAAGEDEFFIFSPVCDTS